MVSSSPPTRSPADSNQHGFRAVASPPPPIAEGTRGMARPQPSIAKVPPGEPSQRNLDHRTIIPIYLQLSGTGLLGCDTPLSSYRLRTALLLLFFFLLVFRRAAARLARRRPRLSLLTRPLPPPWTFVDQSRVATSHRTC